MYKTEENKHCICIVDNSLDCRQLCQHIQVKEKKRSNYYI